jgi:hypothetical protein
MKRSLTAFLILLALAGAAQAFGLGLGNRFGRLGSFGAGSGSAPPGTNFLLVNTGSKLLANTGSAILIQ